ncbi:MAG: hypothetical protein ACI8UO_002931 [Verrucomicrobiales bacterium]|jgi:hypothetical protein
MKMVPTNKLKTILAAFALQLGIFAGANAGGPAILHLPIEGVTSENSDQCAKLFEEKFASVITLWKGGDIKMIKDGSTNLIQVRPENGQISLSDVEKALEGSPFSIKREQLEFISVVQLRIEKIEEPEKLVRALETLDGKKLQGYAHKETDGILLITLMDPRLNIPPDERGVMPLITHQRLTSYLSENGVKLISIS